MSRFSQIAKIKNHKVEEIQKQLQKELGELEKVKQKEKMLQSEMHSRPKPTAGTIKEYRDHQKNIALIRDEMMTMIRTAKVIEFRIFEARKNLKLALIEYEKMDYLDKEEKAREIKRLKSIEVKNLEEIAVNGHYIKQKVSEF